MRLPFKCLFVMLCLYCLVGRAEVVRTSAFTLLPDSAMATTVHVCDSGLPGPTVLIVGGVHGNEPAGWKAAQRLLAAQPARGQWVILPLAIQRAAAAGVRMTHDMQDLNRSFPGQAQGTHTEQLAAAIFALAERYRPVLVLDLHEAGTRPDPATREIVNTLILGRHARAAEIALDVLEAFNAERDGKPFSFLAGAPPGSLNREVSRRLDIPVITVETDRRAPLPERVETQLDLLARMLATVGAPIR